MLDALNGLCLTMFPNGLSLSFLYVCGFNRARTERNTKRGKKGKIIYSSGVTRTIHKYCHSISMVIDWILRAVGWCSVWCAAWMVRVCMGLEYKNATSLVSLRCDWSLNKWLGSHLKWKKHCWKLAIGSILVESNQRDVNGSDFPHFHFKCCIRRKNCGWDKCWHRDFMVCYFDGATQQIEPRPFPCVWGGGEKVVRKMTKVCRGMRECVCV